MPVPLNGAFCFHVAHVKRTSHEVGYYATAIGQDNTFYEILIITKQIVQRAFVPMAVMILTPKDMPVVARLNMR
jgi:hypothetical protein